MNLLLPFFLLVIIMKRLLHIINDRQSQVEMSILLLT